MDYANIVEYLSKEYHIKTVSKASYTELLDVALIDSKQIATNKTTLYFGYDKQLSDRDQIPYNCILAKTGSFPIPDNVCGNLSLVDESELFSIFNDSMYYIKSKSKGFFEELSELANKSGSIDAVIDAASIRLGASLIFCDMNYKIISHSTTFPVIDPLWEENIKQGFCSYEFIKGIKELKSIQNTSNTTNTIDVSCPLSPHRKLTCKVFHNQRQIGFLLEIEAKNSILPTHFELLSTISHVVSYTIACYSPYLFEEKTLYQETLYDMLIGAPSSSILPRLNQLRFPAQMMVLFIRPTIYLGQQHLIDFLNNYLSVLIPEIHATYHNNGIVAVIPNKKEQEEDTKLWQTLGNFCKQEHLQIGISNPFTNIERFTNFFKQAYASLELCQHLRNEETICFYQNYHIYDLFSEIKNSDHLGRFCHPALAILRQHDHTNNSELYKTLCIYIDKGCNIKFTSESLYIHRNSLVYRLNRIEKLCQIDLSDIHTTFLLRLSFLLDHYNNLNDYTKWHNL